MTMEEFCRLYHLNRATVWKLRQKGKGPKVLQVGRRVLIPYEAVRAWEQRMMSGGVGDADAA
ncbi:helix-turn-helix domain-containing protein [Paraburkholderia sp. JPY169]|uniref:Helix-turn-helix domain-containing protein n=2 Tax=Paraburkholderia youngii TaxID=2782701 RepID=A0A7Y6JZP0_9BURK|nr:helix-turn-helix domain-containing protein [Paraburkholderia youngii]